ncbi:MAG: SAF domain-containing protein [Candidatus Dormibacteraeota bacterium]|uniref:SAF domain-containing protein n=1 Tax=Candidatus Aeolococcus gillhamiae TaxID=3127015 RepID=A0A934JYA0_9BACT|nr:SAF domain-containing protein [Candidatus Dormibacteraeota bacterium]
MALGVLLVVGSALTFYAISNRLSAHRQILAVSHAISAGQVFGTGDFTLVTVSVDTGGLRFISQADESTVIGRQAAVPIPAGAPLVQEEVGPPAPASGLATIGVLCKPGQYPPSLAAGDHVEVINAGAPTGLSGGTSSASATATPIAAVVTAVDAPTDTATNGQVVSLQVSADDVAAVARAAAAGTASLVLVAPAG